MALAKATSSRSDQEASNQMKPGSSATFGTVALGELFTALCKLGGGAGAGLHESWLSWTPRPESVNDTLGEPPPPGISPI